MKRAPPIYKTDILRTIMDTTSPASQENYRNLVAHFVINLDGSEARMQTIRQQLEGEGVEFSRISAVDGRTHPAESHPEYDKRRAENYMGRPVLGAEIGCFKSHIRAATAFLESGAKYGLIFEDDAMLLPQSLPLLYKLIAWLEEGNAQEWQLINIAHSSWKFFSPLQKFTHETQTHTIGHAYYFPMIAAGLLWNRQSAADFIKTQKTLFAPVDNYFRYWLTRTGKGFAFDTPIIATTGSESDIDHSSSQTRKSIPRKWHYFFSKQARLNADKVRAWRHLRARKKTISAQSAQNRAK